jgi:hypothetical protein
MADIFDQASERETRDRELAIQAVLRASSIGLLTPNGRCYNCQEAVGRHQLFCDSDCSAYHEQRQRARRY